LKSYHAPWWLLGSGALGGNAQTIWPALLVNRSDDSQPRFVRERWIAPDSDFIDVDRLPVAGASASRHDAYATHAGQDAPLMVLFHGLEGSSRSHYAIAFADRARSLGWHFAIPHFRGCSGELNLLPRAYHSGDYEEVGWMLDRFRQRHAGPIVAVGVSLGGNALLRWAEEAGNEARRTVRAVAAVSAPVDLAAGGHAIGAGFNRLVYTRMFLSTMRPKALAKLAQHPGLFERERLMAARNLYDFDNVFTAPLHGFRDTDDYWARASAKPHLADIRIPALVLNALNDPFVPRQSLPASSEAIGKFVTLWQPAEGGHVGFPYGPFPASMLEMPTKVCAWLQERL
jgi:predicted alpha/beta-fold hydrolase